MPVARFLLNTIPLSKSIFRETNHRTCEGSGGITGAGRGRGLRPWSAPSPRAGRPSPPRTLTGAEGDAENGLDSRTWSAPFPIKPPSSTLQARPLGASPDLPSGGVGLLPAATRVVAGPRAPASPHLACGLVAVSQTSPGAPAGGDPREPRCDKSRSWQPPRVHSVNGLARCDNVNEGTMELSSWPEGRGAVWRPARCVAAEPLKSRPQVHCLGSAFVSATHFSCVFG